VVVALLVKDKGVLKVTFDLAPDPKQILLQAVRELHFCEGGAHV
jgi:hypothetical protein